MKTLIVYYSFTGNNEKLARHLQQKLNADLEKVAPVRRRTGLSIMLDLLFNRRPEIKPLARYLDDYDHVIFMAPIWAGKIATPMKTLLMREWPNVREYSFITLCGGNPGQKEKIRSELVAVLQKRPVRLLELWVNDLLPPGKRDTIKFTTGYRIPDEALDSFDNQLRDFVREEELADAV